MKIVNIFSKENNKPLNLHLGCGTKKYPKYINIDLYNESEGNNIAPDLNLDITKLDEYVDEDTVERILIVHVIEHFNRWEAIDLFNKFYKSLKKDGVLEIEIPDLDGCINFYVKNRGSNYISPLGPLNRGLVQFYGNQWSRNIWETHKYLWRKEEIKDELIKIGFTIDVLDNNTRFHFKERDMRVLARK